MKHFLTKSLLSGLVIMGVTIPTQASDPMLGMLPVHTPELSPGKVVRRSLNQVVSPPVFIVGDDPLSHRWLEAKRDYLVRIHAMGMVVNVRDKAGWHRLQRYGLPLYPVPGHDFAKAFEINHYPVLLEQHDIKQ